jgi:glutamyl-tRNA synthetase
VPSPVELRVEGGKFGKIELRNHPTQDLGNREVEIANKFYITSPDAEDLQIGQKVRLMELYNIKILEIRYENNKKVLIGSYEGDLVIQNIKKAGTLVQFIRFGFCSILNGKSATYTHR